MRWCLAKLYGREVHFRTIFRIIRWPNMLVLASASVSFSNQIWQFLKSNFSFFPSTRVSYSLFSLFWMSLYILEFRFSVFAIFLLPASLLSAVVRRGSSTLLFTNSRLISPRCHFPRFFLRCAMCGKAWWPPGVKVLIRVPRNCCPRYHHSFSDLFLPIIWGHVHHPKRS